MKRWFSLVLILVLLCSALPGAALAEPVDPDAGDATALLSAAGLVVDGGDGTPAAGSGAVETLAENDANETFSARYARVTEESAGVFADAAAETAFATIPAGSVLLVVGGESQGRVKAAFYTGQALVEGYLSAAALADLTDDEIGAYMDAATAQAVAAYQDDPDRPLIPVQCAFAEAPAAEKPEAGESAGGADETTADGEANPNGDDNGGDVDTGAQPGNDAGEQADGGENGAPADGKPANEGSDDGVGGENGGAPANGEGVAEEPIAGESVSDESADGENGKSADGEGEPSDGENGEGENGEPADGESADGENADAEAEPVPATSIRLSHTSLCIGKKELYSGLRVIPEPEGSVLQAEVTWRTDNGKILAVDQNGQIYGRKYGTACVYAKMADGNEVACRVYVFNAPGKLYLSAYSLSLSGEGMAYQLTTGLKKRTASGQITFASSDPAVAEVSPDGLITALTPGVATVSARTYNGVTAYCRVNVAAAPASAEFSAQSRTIGVGQKAGLIVAASDADGKAVPASFVYSIGDNSANPECVQLDPVTGQVTGLCKGQATIVATAHNGVTASCTVEVLPAPSGITLNKTFVYLGLKEYYTDLACALVAPEGEEACAAAVTWSVSNRKILSVNQEGHVYARKKGTAYVYATTHNGKSVCCRVTVLKAPKRVYLSPSSLSMSADGMIAQLQTGVTKKSASGKLTFTSSDPSVAEVGPDGLVTALNPGTATITLRSYNGRVAYCRVQISAPPKTATFPEDSYTIGVGQKMTAPPAAQNADGAAVPANFAFFIDEKSPDASCVALDKASGQITGVHNGRAIIGVVTHNGVTASFTVNVVAAPVGITMNRSCITIGKKELYSDLACALMSPEDEEECAGSVTWSSSNRKILLVDQNGQVYGKKAGTAYVYVTTHNGKSTYCKVIVRKAIKWFSISPNPSYLYAGDTNQYRVNLNKGAGGTITWASSDESVAVVDAYSGKVTALKPGVTVISARTYNGKTAYSKLTVRDSALSAVSSSDPRLLKLLAVANSKLNCVYRSNTHGPNTFDCSGFTYYCYKQIGYTLSAKALTQGNDLRYAKIRNVADLRPGDLIFFDTNETDGKSAINHAALYIGNFEFIHASSSAGKVIVSSLKKDFYARTFWWGYRVLD